VYAMPQGIMGFAEGLWARRGTTARRIRSPA